MLACYSLAHYLFNFKLQTMDFSQKITLLATITVNLNVPELQSREQLNEWIKSDAARIHFIDHLKPTSFDDLEVVKAASEADVVS